MKLRELPPSQKPRERLLSQGVASLSEIELISLIIQSGTQQKDVFALAQHIISKLGQDTTISELKSIPGIGTAKACQILALIEFGKRRKKNFKTAFASNAKTIYSLFGHLKDQYREEFVVLFLNTKLGIISHETVFTGTLDSVTVHPREIYFRAIKHLAHSIIVLHNHPSGNPAPSQSDTSITEHLKKAGDIIGIPLLDHIIIGNESYYSYAENMNII